MVQFVGVAHYKPNSKCRKHKQVAEGFFYAALGFVMSAAGFANNKAITYRSATK